MMETRKKQKKLNALFTLDDGFQFKAELTPLKRTDTRRLDQLERDLVENFNLSQPNMVHKVIKCHIFRN